ncbi:hypothetical protein ACFX15_034668 [Malus domestica]
MGGLDCIRRFPNAHFHRHLCSLASPPPPSSSPSGKALLLFSATSNTQTRTINTKNASAGYKKKGKMKMAEICLSDLLSPSLKTNKPSNKNNKTMTMTMKKQKNKKKGKMKTEYKAVAKGTARFLSITQLTIFPFLACLFAKF